jgi:hypothetical protein
MAQDASLDEDTRLTALGDLEMVKFSFLHAPPPQHHSAQLLHLCHSFRSDKQYFYSFHVPLPYLLLARRNIDNANGICTPCRCQSGITILLTLLI